MLLPELIGLDPIQPSPGQRSEMMGRFVWLPGQHQEHSDADAQDPVQAPEGCSNGRSCQLTRSGSISETIAVRTGKSVPT